MWASFRAVTITARAPRRCRRPRPPPESGVFFEHQQGGGFSKRLFLPLELTLERADPLHHRQRRPPFFVQGESPVLVLGLPYTLALEELGQLGTCEGTRLRQNPNLLVDGPLALRALCWHDRKTTRLLAPPRECLLAEAGFHAELPRTDRIFASQPRNHLLFKG
jgi:hypothetical protein